MKPGPALRIMAVATLCAAALVGVVVNESVARDRGQEIMLPMQAVDPRDLLSGHYVIVDLRQTLPAGQPCPEQHSDWDWLAFRPAGAVLHLVGAARAQESALDRGPVAIRGHFTCSEPTLDGTPGVVAYDLGINRFYIHQTEAERISSVLRTQQPGKGESVFAIISVGQDGRARLKGLLVQGQRLELSWL